MLGNSARSSALTFLVLVLAGFTVYFNSLDVPFYLDDFRNITENRYVRINDLSPRTLFDAAFKSPIATRPVANVSFAVNYFVHQEKVGGYHLVNTFIHITTAFVLYLLFSTTLRTPGVSGAARSDGLLPFLASLLWMVHPLHTGSVTYIVQRMVLLASLFYLLSLLCYARGRMSGAGKGKWGWFSCSLAAGLLALGSKEIAVTLPFFILLYEWFFFQDLDRKWLAKWVGGGALTAVLFSLLYFVFIGDADFLLTGYDNRPFTPVERIYTEFRVVFLYISLMAFPSSGRLNLDHDISISHSLFDPLTTMLSGLALAALLLYCLLAAKERRIMTFAVLWYLGNLVLESSFIGLELIFEHRLYLPSVFLILAFAWFVLRVIQPRTMAAGLLAAVIAVCSYWTMERNDMWRDPVLFWTDSAAKSPEKARPFMNLSVALRERGDLDGAVAASRRAIAIDPGFVNAYVGLGAAFADKGDFAGAEIQYLKALQMMPDYTKVLNALGVLYAKQGRTREALAAFDENLRVDPFDINALVNRASVMAVAGNMDQAVADFSKAADLDGKNPDILFNLAIAYTRNGNMNKAVQTYEEVLRLRPGDLEARENLELLRSRLVK